MDDRSAQFLLMCEDICHAAFLADIPVEVGTRDGRRLHGIPNLSVSGEVGQMDRSGELVIDLGDDRVALDAVVTVAVRAPIDAAR